MFGLRPSAPTRPEDYAVDRAGRPLRNIRLKPRGLTPRRLAQLTGADLGGVQHVTPDPWVPAPAVALSDVIAGPEPWMGMLLDPARPRSVAAYLDEPAMAHFTRELDEAAAEAAIAEQGDGPLDVQAIDCVVAGGYGANAAAADAVTAWIAETLRRGNPTGGLRAAVPRAPGRRAHPSQHTQRRLVCRWL